MLSANALQQVQSDIQEATTELENSKALQRVLCVHELAVLESQTAQRTPVSGRGCALRNRPTKTDSVFAISAATAVPALRLMARFFSCLLKTPVLQPGR